MSRRIEKFNRDDAVSAVYHLKMAQEHLSAYWEAASPHFRLSETPLKELDKLIFLGGKMGVMEIRTGTRIELDLTPKQLGLPGDFVGKTFKIETLSTDEMSKALVNGGSHGE